MPRRSETTTKVLIHLVNLLRKVVIDWSVNLNSLFNISLGEGLSPFLARSLSYLLKKAHYDC